MIHMLLVAVEPSNKATAPGVVVALIINDIRHGWGCSRTVGLRNMRTITATFAAIPSLFST